MQIRHNHSSFHIARRRAVRAGLALAALLGAAACASSGSSASGTYRPTPDVGSGASWPGEPSGVHINVSLGERKLYLKDGPRVMQAYTIGIGQPGYPTPQGDYSVRRIVWNPPWNPPDAGWAADKEPQPPGAADNPMKVVKIYFNEPDYYIHGTGNVESLGGAVSHGCLRMTPSDAASLARALMDAGGASRDAAWFRRVQSTNETETVVLPTGIPMHVAQ